MLKALDLKRIPDSYLGKAIKVGHSLGRVPEGSGVTGYFEDISTNRSVRLYITTVIRETACTVSGDLPNDFRIRWSGDNVAAIRKEETKKRNLFSRRKKS